MQCREFQVRLDDVLDSRGQPESDVVLRAHADTCRPCRDLLATQESLFAGLSNARLPSVGHDLADRVLIDFHTTPRATIGSWQLAIPLLAAAAAVLIAVLPLLKTTGQAPHGSQVAGDPELGSAASAVTPANVVNSIGIQASRPRPGGPYVIIVRETGQGIATVVFQQFPGVGLASLAGDTADPLTGQSPWVSQMAGGLKPITDSMSEAFNTLLRALPHSGQESRS